MYLLSLCWVSICWVCDYFNVMLSVEAPLKTPSLQKIKNFIFVILYSLGNLVLIKFPLRKLSAISCQTVIIAVWNPCLLLDHLISSVYFCLYICLKSLYAYLSLSFSLYICLSAFLSLHISYCKYCILSSIMSIRV